ncbi:MAG: hypothetical protein ACJ731_08000 [Vicinamibacterales bacterium]
MDDYCPRERRLTNHAVVAMIEEDVKQTRCTTCDAEHAYKGGKVPKRRKKETPATLYKEVLAGQPNVEVPAIVAEAEPAEVADADQPMMSAEATDLPSEAVIDQEETAPDAEEPIEHDAGGEQNHPQPEIEEGPVHRPLIRAQLPRIEGQKEERRPPDFTIRQRGNGHFRGDSRVKPHRPGGNGQPGNNGNRGHGGPRFAGPRPAGSPGRGQQGRGGQSGFRPGQRQGGGGRKRSR